MATGGPADQGSWWKTSRGFAIGAFSLFCLALGVRLVWTFFVQPPEEVVYSDMAGYVTRAQRWLAGRADTDWSWAVYPPGTHWWYGIWLFLLGPQALAALGLIQALCGAAVVPLAMAIARRAMPTTWAYLPVGIVTALWPPQIAFAGYFSSEVPYSLFLTASTWLWVRLVQTGRGALVTGTVSGLAYLVRPPILMTVLLALAWLVARRRQLPRVGARQIVLLCAALIAVVGATAARYHALTGEFGLISGNGRIVNFFAWTDYGRIESHDKQTNLSAWFAPPPVAALGHTRVFRFEGRSIDASTLATERDHYLAQRSFLHRLALLQRNIRLLALDNEAWPESEHAATGVRRWLHETSAWLLAWLLGPLALAGVALLGWRRNLALELLALHVVTCVYAAAVYLGEVRYRVPYDGLLVILAVYPAMVLFGRIEDSRQDPQARGIIWAVWACALLLMVVPWRVWG